MSSREIQWLEAAVDAGEAADLGEFCDTIPYNRRYVWFTVFLTVAGWFLAGLTVVAMYLAKTREGESVPVAEYLFLIGFAALALGGPFGIRSTGRDARARVYLFDDGLVYTDRWGESATVAWRDVVVIQRTSVRSSYTSSEVGRRYALLTASGGGFYADEWWSWRDLLPRAIETAIADGRLGTDKADEAADVDGGGRAADAGAADRGSQGRR